MYKLNFSFFLLGLAFGIGPCLASCGPLLISYIAATNKNIKTSVFVYLLFSLSRVSVYSVLSISIFLFGQALTNYFVGNLSRYLFIFGGLFIISIGVLVMLGNAPQNQLCQRMHSFFLKKDAKTVIILGLVIGILPCAPLISILSYIGLMAKSWLNALLLGFSFGLGTTFSPLLILAAASGSISKFAANNKFYRIFYVSCGAIIIFLGFQLMRRAF